MNPMGPLELARSGLRQVQVLAYEIYCCPATRNGSDVCLNNRKVNPFY